MNPRHRSSGRPLRRSSTAAIGCAVLVGLAALAAGARGPSAAEPGTHDHDSSAEMIGRPAPALDFDRWIGAKPMTLEGLRGKVVLLRWWTEGCRFCRATLPVIERARREHPDDLVVIGVFHPKPPRPVSDRHVLSVAKSLGYAGAIAVDAEWSALDRWWLAGDPERAWTSVSFLVDRAGNVRWVHGGGEFHPGDDPRHARCDVQHAEFQAKLAALLAERPPAP